MNLEASHNTQQLISSKYNRRPIKKNEVCALINSQINNLRRERRNLGKSRESVNRLKTLNRKEVTLLLLVDNLSRSKRNAACEAVKYLKDHIRINNFF